MKASKSLMALADFADFAELADGEGSSNGCWVEKTGSGSGGVSGADAGSSVGGGSGAGADASLGKSTDPVHSFDPVKSWANRSLIEWINASMRL